VRKAFNPSSAVQGERSEEAESPTSHVYENVPSPSIHLGTTSEITHFSSEIAFDSGPRSEITDLSGITCSSRTPISAPSPRHSRFPLRRSNPQGARSSSNLGFLNPTGHFSRSLRDRGKFLWLLIKLNFRMLISLTLTLFVAILVVPPSPLSPCESGLLSVLM
jgi:hypothetical protein